MKTIALIMGKNHIELTAYQHTDNFGTQYLEYVLENLDGSRISAYSSHDEGSWLVDNKKMISEFKGLKKFSYGKGVKS